MYTSTLSVLLLATQALSVFAAPATHGAGIYRRQEAAVNATAQEARIKDLATKFEQLRAAVDVTEGKTTTPEETTANIDSLANALTIGEAGKSAGTAASADQLKAGEELLAVKNSIIAVGTEAAASDKQRLDEIAAGAGNGTAAVDPAASADRVNKLALSFEGVRAAINTAQGKENATEADLTERIDTLSKKIVLGEEGKSAGDAATPEQLAVGQELLAVKNSLIAVGQAGAETNDERLAEIAAGANSTAAVGAAATGKEKLIADLEAALAEAKAL